MASLLFKVGLGSVALLAVLFQVYLKEIIWLGFGIGKTLQPLSDFPYTCRTITDSRMEACEDMWLSESTRQLFLACSDPIARSHWMPSVADFNVTGRSQRDAMVVLDIDKPVENGFEMRVLKTPGYTGTAGDGLLDLAGFTGTESNVGTIELLVVNHRPSVDAETGQFLDNTSIGGNSTIELFETGPDASELKHIRTYASKHITTPNRVAAADGGSFFVANDHGPYKLGLKHHLSPIIGTGGVTYCDKDTGCRPVAGSLSFPNGLVNGQDGLLYVPSSMLGTITIYRIAPVTDKLEKVDEVSVGYGIDNLSIDQNGDMYIAVFPVGVEIFKAYKDPYNARPPSAALRMRKGEGGYVVEKIIEDAFGEVLPVATTVIHDAKTGRLFFSSVISPFISVCEPKN
ncbi:hypothetical protein EDB81DRAFT_809202 [Dactylonectria macrodidyma]|uniref:Calcium-dependent phosphotriesterase n=1 Tax=Dactylonectria macrodidyma TaxID=307937 RepID=A0A9P9DYM2_9HYPO|nr:hypothetical protein EDB81DRAFT_809202 [Dactylonectria macrodidyma]